MTPEANRLSRLARSMLNAIKSGDASADEVSEHLLKLQDLCVLVQVDLINCSFADATRLKALADASALGRKAIRAGTKYLMGCTS
jgi:hypothetical protein